MSTTLTTAQLLGLTRSLSPPPGFVSCLKLDGPLALVVGGEEAARSAA